MKSIFTGAALAIALAGQSIAMAASEAPPLKYTPWPGEELDAETRENINAYLDSLTPLYGEITLDKANAKLDVSSNYYFLDAKDAQSVLEDAWGNPPDNQILGMIFPAGASPLDMGVWGASIHFSGDGYVSDEDAHAIDYDELLTDMQESQTADNKWRSRNGYAPIEIIGWAETPSYNAETHKLYWAKEMKFGEEEHNTLNYDIRVLGRRGALVMSFIATMDELGDIRKAAPAVLEMAHFEPGATYAEYQPGVDKKAAYGIAGLIGGAALAKKTGLLAALLLFGKKFIVFIVAGVVAAFGAAKRFLFGGAR